MTVEQAQASSIEVDKRLRDEGWRSPAVAQIREFGIKAKLFLAFFSLAGLTALASAVAWYVFCFFRDMDRAVTHHGRKRSRHGFRP